MSNAIFTNLSKKAQAASKEVMQTINAITDDSSFVETDKFICGITDLGEAVGEGVVTGFAHISDIRIGLFATNSKVLKGSIGRVNSRKIVKLIDSAVCAGLPVIGILDTAGARFSEGIDSMEGYADIYAALAQAYGNVPTVMAVKGSNFGLSSYFCAVTDLCVAYNGSQIATSSPMILAANGKEDLSSVCTGTVLSESSDLVTQVVKNDSELKKVINDYLQIVTCPIADSKDDPNRTVCADALKNPDSILSGIFDKNSILSVRGGYEPSVKTGFARLGGIAVGYVMTDGKLTGEGAEKITELLDVCESFDLPVVNFVNCDGCATSVRTDGKIMRKISDMMFTYYSMTVAKITVVYGSAVGVGYTAFVAKAAADYSLAWADAKIGVISSESAAQLLYKDELAKAADKEKVAKKLAQAYNDENMLAPSVARKGFIDNVIDSALTRPYLVAALQTFVTKG